MGTATAPPPLAIGPLIRGAFASYRVRPGLFLLASAVVQLPTALLTLLVGYGASATLDAMLASTLPEVRTLEQGVAGLLSMGGDRLVVYLVLLVGSSLLSVIATVLSAGALAYLLPSPAVQLGAIREAYRAVFQRLWPLFGAVLLAGVIIFGVLVAVLVILVFLAAVQYMLAPAGEAPPVEAQLTVWVVLCILVLGGLGYALFAIVRWALFVQAVVLEDAGPAAALRRSAALLKGRWWRTAALLGVLALGQIALGVLTSALLRGLLPPQTGEALAGLVGGGGWAAVNVAYFPLAANALTLLYLGLRARERADVAS